MAKVGLGKGVNENRVAKVGLGKGCIDKKPCQRLGKGYGKAITFVIAFIISWQRWCLTKGSVRIEWQRLGVNRGLHKSLCTFFLNCDVCDRKYKLTGVVIRKNKIDGNTRLRHCNPKQIKRLST